MTAIKFLETFFHHFFPGCLEKLKNGKKRDFLTPKMPKKLKNFWNQSFFKLQTSMIAQNDRNKILSNYLLLHFFPGCLEKLKNGKNVVFLPQKFPKNRKIFETNHFLS